MEIQPFSDNTHLGVEPNQWVGRLLRPRVHVYQSDTNVLLMDKQQVTGRLPAGYWQITSRLLADYQQVNWRITSRLREDY